MDTPLNPLFFKEERMKKGKEDEEKGDEPPLRSLAGFVTELKPNNQVQTARCCSFYSLAGLYSRSAADHHQILRQSKNS
jgi:hypothetical protein